MSVTSPDNSAGAANAAESQVPPRQPLTKWHRIISRILLSILLLGILIPIGIFIGYGISAYTTYTNLRGQAQNGVQHLLNVKTIFTGVQAHPSGFLDTGTLHRAQREFVRANADFQQVQYKLDHSSVIQ